MSGEGRVRTLVFIPTHNDTQLLDQIVQALRSMGECYQPLIIDDGSTVPIDVSTFRGDALYFRLPANFGLGTVTHIAFDHALRHNYDTVVRLDADGQHPLEMIPELLQSVACGEADLVVGVRMNRHEGGGVRAAAAKAVRRYLSFIARLMTGGRAPSDVNSGFYAVSSRAITVLNTNRLERYPEPQMYVLAGRQRLVIREVPIEQKERAYGASTITLGRALGMFYRFNIFVLGEWLQRSKPR